MRAGQRRIRTLQWTAALTILLALFVARPAGAQPGVPSGDPSVLPPGAKLETLFSGAFFTEGVAAGHDGMIYFSAYDLAPDRTAKFRRTLVDYAPEDGPDGLVVDVDGNLYVAERSEKRPGIAVRTPEGRELAFIPTEIPTNVGFGRGPDSKVLYITAGKSLYRIRMVKDGHHPG